MRVKKGGTYISERAVRHRDDCLVANEARVETQIVGEEEHVPLIRK